MSENSNDLGKQEKTERQALLERLKELDPESENYDDGTVLITKPKRKLTAQQIENLNKGRQMALKKKQEAQAQKRLEECEIENEVKRRLEKYKQEVENKIIKKAISIKKKEIKKQAILEEISDDEDDTPVVKQKVKPQPKSEAPAPVKENTPLPQSENQTKPKIVFL